ncbi:MAG: hypothetical protein ACK4SZ_03045 [Allosphingosinicella sp.]|uniref:hypothetical protein n=1 Tax=Allosphingosinicella sp. TaxID=2823234 RepID=UPI0039504AFD
MIEMLFSGLLWGNDMRRSIAAIALILTSHQLSAQTFRSADRIICVSRSSTDENRSITLQRITQNCAHTERWGNGEVYGREGCYRISFESAQGDDVATINLSAHCMEVSSEGNGTLACSGLLPSQALALVIGRSGNFRSAFILNGAGTGSGNLYQDEGVCRS